METYDDVIFDDDEFLDDVPNPQNDKDDQNLNNSYNDSYNTEDDLTNEVLRLKGISDPNKIKFEEQSGAIIERPWDTLSRDEQLNILAGNDYQEGYDLDDQEIELLNTIRSSGMSVSDYMNTIISNNSFSKQSYKIDQLSDEEVYALDLMEKVGSDNITEEEIQEAIQQAKQNETLFNKTVEGLRNEYIRLQQDEEAQQINEQAEKQRAAYNDFASSIITQIRGLNSFAGQDLEISNEDAEELAAFMLDLDESGVSAFGHALQDPELFTKAAFWLLNEDEIIEELTRQMQDNYKRGYEAAKADLQGKSTLVFNKPKAQKQHNDDFFVDDEEW